MHPCSSWRLILPIFLVCSLPAPAMAQAAGVPGQAPAAAQGTAASAQALPSPVQAEKQRPLNVDTDPVASPDAPEPVAPKGAPTTGVITKSGGQYTLQRNVDEVVL